jgi:hypothetical protein
MLTPAGPVTPGYVVRRTGPDSQQPRAPGRRTVALAWLLGQLDGTV